MYSNPARALVVYFLAPPTLGNSSKLPSPLPLPFWPVFLVYFSGYFSHCYQIEWKHILIERKFTSNLVSERHPGHPRTQDSLLTHRLRSARFSRQCSILCCGHLPVDLSVNVGKLVKGFARKFFLRQELVNKLQSICQISQVKTAPLGAEPSRNCRHSSLWGILVEKNTLWRWATSKVGRVEWVFAYLQPYLVN